MNTDLLSRLSAATGPSRELDAEIALANGWIQRPHAVYEWLSPAKTLEHSPPRYTESIDAALTLLNDTWSWSLCSYETYYKAKIWIDIHNLWRGNGTSPALALVIACLKAKEDSKP